MKYPKEIRDLIGVVISEDGNDSFFIPAHAVQHVEIDDFYDDSVRLKLKSDNAEFAALWGAAADANGFVTLYRYPDVESILGVLNWDSCYEINEMSFTEDNILSDRNIATMKTLLNDLRWWLYDLTIEQYKSGLSS